MKQTLFWIGIAAAFIGTVWIFQGIGVLPGSFMTGQAKWAVIGAIVDVVAVALMVFARRGRPKS